MLSHQAYLFPWIPFYKKTLILGLPKKIFLSVQIFKKITACCIKFIFKTDFDKELYKQIKKAPYYKMKSQNIQIYPITFLNFILKKI